MANENLTAEERLERAKLPGKKAPGMHAFYRGKIETTLKCAVTSFDDFGIWYTPGVAAPCREIEVDKKKVFDYTNKAKGPPVQVLRRGRRVPDHARHRGSR